MVDPSSSTASSSPSFTTEHLTRFNINPNPSNHPIDLDSFLEFFTKSLEDIPATVLNKRSKVANPQMREFLQNYIVGTVPPLYEDQEKSFSVGIKYRLDEQFHDFFYHMVINNCSFVDEAHGATEATWFSLVHSICEKIFVTKNITIENDAAITDSTDVTILKRKRPDGTVATRKTTNHDSKYATSSKRIGVPIFDIENKRDEMIDKRRKTDASTKFIDEAKLLCICRSRLQRFKNMSSLLNSSSWKKPFALGMARFGSQVVLIMMWEGGEKPSVQKYQHIKPSSSQEMKEIVAESSRSKLEPTQWKRIIQLDISEPSDFIRYINLNWRLLQYCEWFHTIIRPLLKAEAEPQEERRRPSRGDELVKVLTERPEVTTALWKREKTQQSKSESDLFVRKYFSDLVSHYYESEVDMYNIIGSKPFVPKLLWKEQHPDHSFIDMDYFESDNCMLHSKEEVKLVFIKILEALCCFYDKGIIHNDLSRGNILWKRSGDGFDVRIIDYSYSYLEDGDRGGYHGTLGYVAPEVWRDTGKEDCRSDVWSVGVLLLEQVLGIDCYGLQKEMMEIVVDRLNSLLEKVSEKMGSELSMVLRGMLQYEVTKRFDSFTALFYLENL